MSCTISHQKEFAHFAHLLFLRKTPHTKDMDRTTTFGPFFRTHFHSLMYPKRNTLVLAQRDKCSIYEFQCRWDKRCIPIEKRCDKVYDCLDRTDEQVCGKCIQIAPSPPAHTLPSQLLPSLFVSLAQEAFVLLSCVVSPVCMRVCVLCFMCEIH